MYTDFLRRGGRALSAIRRRNGAPIETGQEGRRKLTESAMKFPKASAWHGTKGLFREALELRALSPRFRFVRLIQWVE